MAELDSGILVNNYNYHSPSKKQSVCRRERLREVLTKILDNSFSFSDDTILDKLYLHLSENSKKDELTASLLLSWLSSAVKEWANLKKNVKIFALKMAGVTASCPRVLKEMISTTLLLEYCKAGMSEVESDASVTLAVVEMLSEVVKNEDGCVWFLSSGLWDHIFNIHNSNKSIYVTRKTKQLIISLVLVLWKVDIKLCWSIVDSLLAPLNIVKSASSLPQTRQEMLLAARTFINDISTCSCESFSDLIPKCEDYKNGVIEIPKESLKESDKIVPTVQLLCCLMDALLEANCSTLDINIILKNYNLYLWSWEKLSAENYNSKLISSLSSLILYIIYSSMPRMEEKNIGEGDILDTLKSFLFLIQALTSKRQYLVVNNICVQSQRLADKLISTPVYLCKEDGVTYNFRAQILFLHALPIFIFLKMARITHTDVADKFADKLFTLTSICVKRVCYQYRDTLRVCPQCCNTEELLRSSVQTLIGILKYLDKDQVVVVFQSLMHLLREFVPDEYTYMSKVVMVESFELVQRYPNLLMDILGGIEITIKNYNITWSESLETSCVLVLLVSLSCISDLSVPLSTKLLRLIHLAISNFIPPNLALLVENLKNSSLELLGPLLMRKLHDVNWEVRDSSLEVLQTLSFLSAIKFPAFQNLLLELNFPSVIIGMFECDEESYVRSSAIVCLQKMVQVKGLWEEALCDKKLLEKMLECLKNEPEGIVRKEAAGLVMAICVNHEICTYLMEDVYKQLVLSAVSDLHWEVKVTALAFWDAVIDRETANQGMIDGAFPAVTFSKVSRKIVTLTPCEIQKRLKAVLDELEQHGCLQVLWTALNDTSDLEVAKKSAIIIAKLLKLLQQYGVVEETCGRASVLPQLMCCEYNDVPNDYVRSREPTAHLNREGEASQNNKKFEENFECSDGFMSGADEIIKSIMESQDIELISSVYNYNSRGNYEQLEQEGEKQRVEELKGNEKRCNEFITVNEFIGKVTSLNLESVIKVRSEWLMASDDLDSLIEDVLAVSIGDSNVSGEYCGNINAKDCY